MNTVPIATHPDLGPFPQVGTDAVATLVRLSRQLYLSKLTIFGGLQGAPPLTEAETQEFLVALNQADAETWAYPIVSPPPAPVQLEA